MPSNDLLQLQPPWLDAQRPREGRYVLGPLLGKGGMGEVVEAWDVVLCRTVALKILRNMEPTALIRFMHEAQIQARVAHPNICRIYDVDSSESTVKIAMHLVRGPNLEQACRDLSVEEVVTLVAQVAEAIHAAHSLKLIHRDLKPSNILLERGPNGRWVPFICDFGLAMVLDEPALTYSNGIMGTPAYMAPEQFQGERNQIGPATDIYGLGGTLHFALLGHPPAGPTHGVGLRFNASQPAPPTPVRSNLPADLHTVLAKCLEADPALRYGSAAALAEDLWRFLNGEAIHAIKAGPLTRLWQRGRRYLRIMLTSGLMMGSLLTGWIVVASYLAKVHATRLEIQRYFGLEIAELDKAIRFERMLPPHDLRPANAAIQARLQALRARMASDGAEAMGPGHLALAQSHLLLGQAELARQEAQIAWDHDSQGPETAITLATALCWSSWDPETDRPQTRDGAAESPRLEPLLQPGKGPAPRPDPYPRALAAFLRKDYGSAAGAAHSDLKARPWASEAACLEAASHSAMATQHLDSGNLAGADSECREAMAAAQRYLAVAPSDPMAMHSFLLAARLLATLLEDQGSLTPAFLTLLQQKCDQALLLDPGNPRLQEDWLGVRFLVIQTRREHHLDVSQAMNEALVHLGTQLKEPLSPGLRDVRMLLYWQMAELAFEHGEAPGPALAEALQSPGHAPWLRRDGLGQVLIFKARVELTQGVDPRPTLERALALRPSSGTASWTQDETAAEAWLIKGEWEASVGMNATPSFKQAETLSESALQANPRSAAAHALNGLSRLLSSPGSSGQQAPAMLTMVVQERLREALALNPDGRLPKRLQQALNARRP